MAYQDFPAYMRAKAAKLLDQEAQLAKERLQSTIFKFIVVYFDGYLGDLTMTEMRELVVLHGGIVHDKLSPQVTHIIATAMTDAKMRQHKRPVVTPAWILESIQAKRLLSHLNYRLYTALVPSQTTLFNFSNGKAYDAATKAIVCNEGTPVSKGLAIASANDKLESLYSSDLNKAPRPSKRDSDGLIKPPPENHEPPDANALRPTIGIAEDKADASTDSDPDDDWFGPRPNLDVNSDWYKQNVCTAPDFLERFFASSRLHFLSTWKQDLIDFVINEKANIAPLPLDSPFYPRPPKRGPNEPKLRTIAHIDMDCFFASVAIRDKPDLASRPVAVAHSAGAGGKSTSEIASCNYVARSFGLCNGMSIGKARQMCPNLQVVPYEFEKYDEVSRKLYCVLLAVADDVQAVSCDEAYIDISSRISGRGQGQELALANLIRAEIRKQTGCPASVGISENLLVARMATKKAKPDGAFLVGGLDIPKFMGSCNAHDLPGVGWATAKLLAELKIGTCTELIAAGLGALQKHVGEKTGQMLYNYAKGIDPRVLANKPRQSIGAEVNWGVRFHTDDQVETFFHQLSNEIHKRMAKCNVRGRHIAVTLKKRLYDGEPPKILGCGNCENLSKSKDLSTLLSTREQVFHEAWELAKQVRASARVAADEIRGVGIHVTRLDNEQHAREQGQLQLRFVAVSAGASSCKTAGGKGVGPRSSPSSTATVSVSVPVPVPVDDAETRHGKGAPNGETRSDVALPSYEELDMQSIAELPPEIQQEIMDFYQQLQHQNMAQGPPESSSSSDDDEELIYNKRPLGNGERELTMSQLIPNPDRISSEAYACMPPEIKRELDALKDAERRRAASNAKRGGGASTHGHNMLPRKGAGRGKRPCIAKSGRPAGGRIGAGPFAIMDAVLRHSTPPVENGPAESDAPCQPDGAGGGPRPAPVPRFMGRYATLLEIRPVVSAWLHACAAGPRGEDVAALRDYVHAKCARREFDDVVPLVRLMHRKCSGIADAAVQRAWTAVVDGCWSIVDAACVDAYGCRIKRA
ncbi:DNA-directed DNA polymerase [Synchytrium endobioticum]|uniref:DNA repair protein REV1 n=1 Tax=Synchytrium endobioticum TaxID=286115 RepID=A0A507CRQ5_9FUNG|nr:DNA-directed DNA polymerase [Synchytrium endobioticum]